MPLQFRLETLKVSASYCPLIGLVLHICVYPNVRTHHLISVNWQLQRNVVLLFVGKGKSALTWVHSHKQQLEHLEVV